MMKLVRYLQEWFQTTNSMRLRRLSDDRVRSELVELFPFDISVALTRSTPIQRSALTNAVSRWLDRNFDASVDRLGNRYSFGQVILRELLPAGRTNDGNNRRLQSTQLVTYEGVSLWKKDKPIPDETIVAAIELEALLDRDGLVEALQQEDDSTGLGSFVVDARGDLNRNPANSNNGPTQAPTTSADNSLSLIIIVAIVIAVLAFFLLAFALVMAWRHNRARLALQQQQMDYSQDASSPKSPRTGSESDPSSPRAKVAKKRSKHANDFESDPPSEIQDESLAYPESLISEDISTSLSAYYNKGGSSNANTTVTTTGNNATNESTYKSSNAYQKAPLNDAASISSMDSYGYSLDGYASSIAPESKSKK